jgi:Spy/CpxP family protein refolding chaperone
MKKNIIIGMAVVFTLVLVISTAMAFGPGFGRGVSGVPAGYDIPPVSNLTAEQTTKIQALQQKNLIEITPLREQLFAKRTELRTLWASQNTDQAQIKALQQDMLDINAQLQEKATSARLEMSKILTPEQQAQLTAYGRGMGPGMGRMGGPIGRR